MCLSRSSRAKNAAARVIKACTGVADADSHRVSEVYLQGDSITKGTDTEFSLKKRDFVRADTPQMLESSGKLKNSW
jgi:hypothetical protein